LRTGHWLSAMESEGGRRRGEPSECSVDEARAKRMPSCTARRGPRGFRGVTRSALSPPRGRPGPTRGVRAGCLGDGVRVQERVTEMRHEAQAQLEAGERKTGGGGAEGLVRQAEATSFLADWEGPSLKPRSSCAAER